MSIAEALFAWAAGLDAIAVMELILESGAIDPESCRFGEARDTLIHIAIRRNALLSLTSGYTLSATRVRLSLWCRMPKASCRYRLQLWKDTP